VNDALASMGRYTTADVVASGERSPGFKTNTAVEDGEGR